VPKKTEGVAFERNAGGEGGKKKGGLFSKRRKSNPSIPPRREGGGRKVWKCLKQIREDCFFTNSPGKKERTDKRCVWEGGEKRESRFFDLRTKFVRPNWGREKKKFFLNVSGGGGEGVCSQTLSRPPETERRNAVSQEKKGGKKNHPHSSPGQIDQVGGRTRVVSFLIPISNCGGRIRWGKEKKRRKKCRF